MPHTLLGVCTTCTFQMSYPKPSPKGGCCGLKSRGMFNIKHSEIGQKSGQRKNEINVVTKFNNAHRLFGVCTTCPCPLAYRQSCLRRCYRSKSGGTFTTAYYQVGQQAGPRKE